MFRLRSTVELWRKHFAKANKRRPKEKMLPTRGPPPLPHLSNLTSLTPPSLPQKKEKSESERLLTEQLQAKEWELLQLKTEMETSQGTGSAHRIYITPCRHYSKRLSVRLLCVCAHVTVNRKAEPTMHLCV